MKKIISFDVSSTTIGYGILEISDENEIKFIRCGHIKPNHDENIVNNLASTRDIIKSILETEKPTHIAIEELIQFMAGRSSANTVITLTSFNRMVALLCYDYLGKCPEHFSVMSIRHGLKLDKVLPQKEEMPELVAHHLNIKFPYTYTPRKKIAVESYDEADGVAVGLYYSFVLTGKIIIKPKKPKVKVKRKKKNVNDITGSGEST